MPPNYDEPSSKRIRQASNPISHGQTTMNIQDGYGKHIQQTISKIPHHMTTSFVHGTIERSVWITIDFSNNMTSPFLVPYQLMHFWMGMDKNFNNSIRNFNKLNNCCYGVSWHNFQLEIFNQATTRKRLLVQGGTTYETIDFESSQNLLILTNTNKTHQPTMIWPNEYNPPGHQLKDTDLQSGSYQCTTEELAPGHSKHFTFTPESLPEHQCWDIINVDNRSDSPSPNSIGCLADSHGSPSIINSCSTKPS
jgi:hypothetical protein